MLSLLSPLSLLNLPAAGLHVMSWAAMLVVKNKSICLLWELLFSCCIDLQHGRLIKWLQTKNMSPAPAPHY